MASPFYIPLLVAWLKTGETKHVSLLRSRFSCRDLLLFSFLFVPRLPLIFSSDTVSLPCNSSFSFKKITCRLSRPLTLYDTLVRTSFF